MLHLALLFFVVLSTTEAAEPDYFRDMSGCILLYNLKSGKFEKVIGEQVCNEQFPASSSFKIPLAVMAFDSGVLRDENEVLKWDGKKDERAAVNQDHNAKTWLRDSVVWFSQRLVLKMSEPKFQKYLNEFNYGNKDLSGGLTDAWINRPTAPALKISAYEQVEFMQALWNSKLPVSKRAMDLTKKISYLETSPKGFRLSGKTGSNFYSDDRRIRLGWFIGHLARGDREYISVVVFRDLKKPTKGEPYGGFQAKRIEKAFLADQGLW